MNLKTKDLLMELSKIDAPSGFEKEAIDFIEGKIKDSVNVIKRTRLGGLIAGIESKGNLRIGIFAHVDEISFVISKIEKGNFARLETVGGVDPKVVLASEVKILTHDGIARGIIGFLAPHLQKPEDRKKVPMYDEIFVDFSVSSLAKSIKVGDRVVLKGDPIELNGKIVGKALDNRAGCVSLIKSIKLLEKYKIYSNVYYIFSTQEEVGGPGASTIAYELNLDYAIVVDVTHADDSLPFFEKISLGGGPVIGFGPSVDKNFWKKIMEIARKNGIKYQKEPLPGRSGTDTDEIQITGIGVKTALISIPLKYMHTPVEVVDPFDVDETARLLTHIVVDLGV
ncbi:MAG TPA: M42 family peptidase [Thermotoga sp.]|nr:M42 family peptidase [Thermotoga sp.]